MQRTSRLIPICAAVTAFALHVALNPGYGFFRDELYFIICGRHPAFGYVDQPPLVPLLAALSQVFGISLIALRTISAVFAGVSVYVTCQIAKELGGGRFAQIAAALLAFFTPVLMAFGTQVGTDTPGLALWPLAVLFIIRIVKGGDPRLWLAAGAALGIAGNAKYSVLFFAAALLFGLLISRQRQALRMPWFAAGMALGALLVLPNFLWQAAHGFPMIELLRNARIEGKNVVLGPVQYVLQQVFLLNPLLAPFTILGLLWLAIQPRWRWLAYTYAALIAVMIFTHGKNYYPADVYPYLAAAGAVAIESWSGRAARILQPALLAYAAAAGVFFTPFAMPVLHEPAFIAYKSRIQSALHVSVESEHHRSAALGQDFADMHGWPQLAQRVASVYDALPARDRARAVIVGSNYGEAAAIDFFGKRYGLPPTISGHNQYYLWGTRGYSGDVVIDVNGDCGAKDKLFRSAVRAATFTAPYVMPYEDGLPIMVCRGIKRPLAKIWPAVKHYI